MNDKYVSISGYTHPPRVSGVLAYIAEYGKHSVVIPVASNHRGHSMMPDGSMWAEAMSFAFMAPTPSEEQLNRLEEYASFVVVGE